MAALQIAPGHVIANGPAIDMLQRLFLRDVTPGRADNRHQLNFVVEPFGHTLMRWHIGTGGNHAIGGLGEELRVFRHFALRNAARAIAFRDVIHVIAPDAEHVAARLGDRRLQRHIRQRQQRIGRRIGGERTNRSQHRRAAINHGQHVARRRHRDGQVKHAPARKQHARAASGRIGKGDQVQGSHLVSPY